MGRWESTKEIHAYRGYFVNPPRTLSPEELRIRELQRAKREAIMDYNNHEITEEDIQKICDYYGVPLIQAQKIPVSTAEYIEEYDGEVILRGWLENYKWDIETKDSKITEWIYNYDPNSGMTKQEYFREMKKSLRRRGKQTPEQLIKLATDCGVGYTYDNDGAVTFIDSVFGEIVGTILHAQDEDLYHLSPAEQRKIIKQVYQGVLRDPNMDGTYELCKTIVTEHYQIEVQKNDKGTPIGKYRKFLNNFDEVYDALRREGVMPTAEDVIERMDKILAQTEFYKQAKRAEANKKRVDTRRRNKYLKTHPVRKLMYKVGVSAGLHYRTDDDGRPILDLGSS